MNQNLIEELEGENFYVKIQESGSTHGWEISSHSTNTKSDPSLSLSLFFLSFGSVLSGEVLENELQNLGLTKRSQNEPTSTYL